MRTTCKLVLLLSLCAAYNSSLASYTITWKSFHGNIDLMNGDSLQGEILLYHIVNVGSTSAGFRFQAGNEYHYSNPGKNCLGFVQKHSDLERGIEPKWIDYKNISRVRVSIDDKTKKIVIYENIHYGKPLWRLLKKNNLVAIYDNSIVPDRPINYAARKMILVTRVKVYELYSTFNFITHNSKTKLLLLKFINKHYHKKFKKGDLLSEEDLLDYILNTE